MSLAVFDTNNVGGLAVFDSSTVVDGLAGSAAVSVSAAGSLRTTPTLNSTHMRVENLRTGEVYYTKGTGTNRIASITKVMTAKVLLDHYQTQAELESVLVTITSGDLSVGGSGANLNLGDVISLHGLLIDAMLPSSNNACMAIARVIGQKIIDEGGGGTDPVARFVSQMMADAAALGANNTTYVNPHGLSNSNVSTPADLMKIGKQAWQNAVLREVAGTVAYDIPIIRSGSATTLSVTNPNTAHGIEGVIGVKGGSLDSPAIYNNLIWYEPRNGDLLGLCLLGASTLELRTADQTTLINALLADFPELSASIGLNADAQVSVQASGALTTSTSLSGASLVATTATGSLTTGIALQGAASSMALADGTLTVQIRLQGSALSSAIAAAGLTTAVQLAAQAQAGAQASGTLTAPGAPSNLEGHAVAQALASGSITTVIRLDAGAVASVLATGELTVPGSAAELQADATVLALATGGLTTAIPLQGAAASVVQASGTLDLALTFDAQAFASVLSSGVLSTQVRMDAAAVAGALARADLTGGVPVVPPAERTIPVRAQTRVVPVRAQTRLIPA